MKKTIIAALLIALLLTALTACTDEPEILIPSPAPSTEVPAAEFDRGVIGDWYGIFSVGDAGGKYGPNSGKANDCAVRLALNDYGEGPFYCVINGLGDGYFADCRAYADKTGVVVQGTVGGERVDWRFDMLGGKLSLSELYGGGDDYMRVEIVLRHCGDDWSADARRPAGLDHVTENGFYGVVAQMGGDPANMPAVSGEGLNLRLTTDEKQTFGPEFDADGRTISQNGHFSIVMPEGFSVLSDGELFAITSRDGRVRIVYYLEQSEKAPLEALTEHMQGLGHDDIYRYDIDGYDCYATVVRGDNASNVVLIGNKNPGTLLKVNLLLSETDPVNALDGLPDYMQAVLGLLVRE